MVVNGSLRLNVTFLATLNVTRPNLLLRVLLKEMVMTIKRHSHQSHERIPLGLSWH